MLPRRSIVCALVVGFSAGTPALAESLPCGKAQEVERLLGERYGERRVSSGLGDDGRLLQIYASPESRSWTLVHTTATGISCVLAAGWEWTDRQDRGVAARATRQLGIR